MNKKSFIIKKNYFLKKWRNWKYNFYNSMNKFINNYTYLISIMLIALLCLIRPGLPNFIIFTICILYLYIIEFELPWPHYLNRILFIRSISYFLQGLILILLLLFSFMKIPSIDENCSYLICDELRNMSSGDKIFIFLILEINLNIHNSSFHKESIEKISSKIILRVFKIYFRFS